jgi:NADPH2:quinone reductase
LGYQLIATAGSPEKCRLALDHGAAFAIDYRKENFVERVKAITGGKGVKVVYDSVGKDTFEGSLDCLRPFGLMACFGNASGPVPPFAPGNLGPKGSLYLTRGDAGDGRRPVRRGRPRRGDDPHRPALPAGRSGAGTS